MNEKETIIVKEKTFETIKSAVNKLVDMVKPTFGPASNKVIIDKGIYRMVVDDGVQIARDFELNDPAENSIIKIIRETAIKTNDRAGDGTTGALIILQAIINEVSKMEKFDGRKIELELKRGLKEAKEELKKAVKEIKTKDELKKAALISFDNEEIAEMIADTFSKIGKDGIITVDKSQTLKTEIEIQKGIQIKNGYISPYMVTNPERMETELIKPYILITDYRITEEADILPIMEKVIKEKKPLVIIAEHIEGSALATLIINLPQVLNPETQKRGNFLSIAINAPKDKVFLNDLALMTKAKFFTAEKGDRLENALLSDLGKCEKIICRRDETIIINSENKELQKAVIDIKLALENEKDEKQKMILKNRLAVFKNSIAVIKVGALTDNEQKALKYKVEDCINSVKSAYQNGVVIGAGIAFARLNTSSSILKAALKEPIYQLYKNMGLENKFDVNIGEEYSENIVSGKKGNFMEVGVFDPVDVLISGLESAVSIASLLITSSGIIVDIPIKKD